MSFNDARLTFLGRPFRFAVDITLRDTTVDELETLWRLGGPRAMWERIGRVGKKRWICPMCTPRAAPAATVAGARAARLGLEPPSLAGAKVPPTIESLFGNPARKCEMCEDKTVLYLEEAATQWTMDLAAQLVAKLGLDNYSLPTRELIDAIPYEVDIDIAHDAIIIGLRSKAAL